MKASATKAIISFIFSPRCFLSNESHPQVGQRLDIVCVLLYNVFFFRLVIAVLTNLLSGQRVHIRFIKDPIKAPPARSVPQQSRMMDFVSTDQVFTFKCELAGRQLMFYTEVFWVLITH